MNYKKVSDKIAEDITTLLEEYGFLSEKKINLSKDISFIVQTHIQENSEESEVKSYSISENTTPPPSCPYGCGSINYENNE